MNIKAKRVIIILIGICLWIFYIFQKELAMYGMYSVVSYGVWEVASIIPFICGGASIIWLISLIYKVVAKKDIFDAIFVVILLGIVCWQCSYLKTTMDEKTTIVSVEIVSVDELNDTLVVRQVENGHIINLKSPTMINHLLEKDKSQYILSYIWKDNPNQGKLKKIKKIQ